MNRLPPCFLALSLALCTTPNAATAPLGAHDKRVELYLTEPAAPEAASFRVKVDDQIRTSAKSEAQTVYLRKDEVARFYVVQPNLFLFKYGSVKEEAAAVESYKQFKEFADPIIKAFKSDPERSTEATPRKYAQINAKTPAGKHDLHSDLTKIADLLAAASRDIPAAIARTRTDPVPKYFIPANLTEPGEDLLKFFSALEKLPFSPSDEVALDLELNDKAAAMIPTITARSAAELFGNIRTTAKDPVLAGQLEGIYGSRAVLEKAITFVKAYEADVQKSLKVATDGLFLNEHKYDVKNKQPFKFTVSATSTYTDIAGIKDFQENNKKEVTVNVEPYEPFHFRLGVGAVYSFVENPNYKAKTSATGALTIEEEKSDANEFGGAVVGNFYPDAWWNTAFEPFAQVGYSFAKDGNGWLVGAGFAGYKQLSLAAGFIYQQVRALDNGLTVGQSLAKVEDLALRHPYKGGMYVHIGWQF